MLLYGRPLLVLIAFMGAVCLVTQPWQNYLVMDDWTSAASVRALYEGGTLQFIEWTTHFFFTLIFWGFLFCLPFGFSLGALHVSTMVMALFGLWAFYGLLRELNIRRNAAWFAVALMAFLPPFFLLAHSFMDEVPFWSLMMISSYFYIAGQKRQKESLVWWGVLFNLLAFFIKVYAVVGILSLLVYRVTHRKRLYFDFTDLLPVLSFGLIGGALYHFSTLFLDQIISNYTGPTLLTDYYQGYFSDIFYKTLSAILNVSVLLLPLSVAIFDFKKFRGYVYCGLALGTLCIVALYQQGALPDAFGQFHVFNLWELGQSRTYIAGSFEERVIPYWVDWIALAIGLFSGSVLVFVFLETVNDYRKLISDVHLIFYWEGVFLFILMLTFWRFTDQYYILLVPFIIFMGLATKALKPRRIIAGSIPLALWTVISVTGTLDHITHQKNLEKAYTYLVSDGRPPKVIDAGYTINGWYAYAAQKPFSLGQKNSETLIHGITPVDDRPYWILSKGDLKGYRSWKTFNEGRVFWSTGNGVNLLYYNYERPSEKDKNKKRKKQKKSLKE